MASFNLIITADYPNRIAEFRLCDERGVQLAYRQTDFKAIPVGRQQGLFDLRNYLSHYVDPDDELEAVAEVGVCIADEVLGGEIFGRLWASRAQRTLTIRLPGAEQEENHLAAALARVPWEIARPAPYEPTLGERNLVVRVTHDGPRPDSRALEMTPGEPLRVLFVFAEARGSHPLAARQERLELKQMLEREVYPNRQVVADFLTHGVTRERLEAQIRENNGYHVVHWSGHGQRNLLELAMQGGVADHISGEELLEILHDAGGFIPRLFFLSACHSGDFARISNWNDFFAVAQGKTPGTRESAGERKLDLQGQPGFTGTAHALLQGGVPTVVAMRYAISDEYARALAVEFYRSLLADEKPKTAAVALAHARNAMLDPERHDPAYFMACDHATPVLYGEDDARLPLASGRSNALNPRDPRIFPIGELAASTHRHFVGRTWELAGLGAEFIGAPRSKLIKPIAVISGLGGMGKTALVAEALDLWESRFKRVVLFQAKPNPLSLDKLLLDTHCGLLDESVCYHDHVRAYPADAIYREATATFTGAGRIRRLCENLLRAMKDEKVLLVLDNFETNLKPQTEGVAAGTCQDPAWDELLRLLATGLVGSQSRVLITCRRPLAALAGLAAYSISLGPLSSGEAALNLRAHPTLRKMMSGADAEEKNLAARLLGASRFHPLLMDRLARLASESHLRAQLLEALDVLESSADLPQLPALFTGDAADVRELAYLDDALLTSLDQLIGHCDEDTRRLLWVVSLANEPATEEVLQAVWRYSHTTESSVTSSFLDARLNHLARVGLLTDENAGRLGATPFYSCHELIRERIQAWMRRRPGERDDLTESRVRLAYARMFEFFFGELQNEKTASAVFAGSRALFYYVQAEAWDQLGSFVSMVVNSGEDARFLEQLLPHLRTAAESAPEGEAQWSCLAHLADALSNAGQQGASLPYYEQAAASARAVAEAGGDGSRQAWSDLAWISKNWAMNYVGMDLYKEGKNKYEEAIDAFVRADSPRIHIVRAELELLRLDLEEGKVDEALPEIESRLAQVKFWLAGHRAGDPPEEAPDESVVVRTLLVALDVVFDADMARGNLASALLHKDAILQMKQEAGRPVVDIAIARLDRAHLLIEMNWVDLFDEARRELEDCLRLFHADFERKAMALSCIAKLFARQGDFREAVTQVRRALALFEQQPGIAVRVHSHGNLAIYLEYERNPQLFREAARHRMACLVYSLGVSDREGLKVTLHNYAVVFREARLAGVEPLIPRLDDLLADPAFDALARWLGERGTNLEELQQNIDEFLDEARRRAAVDPGDAA